MPDDPDLRERVRELEQTVSEQQETIQKLMPSRRAVVAGMVGAGAGAAGVYAGTDRAQASGHSGQVGTSSDPVNVEGHDVTVANEFSLGGDGPATSFDDLGLGNPLSQNLDFGGNDATNVGALNADLLTIGGILYEEDGNSPLNNSGTSVTYSIAGSYDEILIVPDPNEIGHNAIRINGVSSQDYDHTDTADSETTGDTEIPIRRPEELHAIILRDIDRVDRIGVRVQLTKSGTGQTARATLQNATGSGINSFEFRDTGGTSRAVKARVFGRSMNI